MYRSELIGLKCPLLTGSSSSGVSMVMDLIQWNVF
jgi:hypothetical protein